MRQAIDLLPAFEAQATRVGATVHRAARGDAPARAATILGEADCRTVAVAGAVSDRPAFVYALRAAGLEEAPPATLWPTRRADGGISGASLGVAETGSVLLASSAEDRRVELCVDVHLVLVEVATLVPDLGPALAALRALAARPPVYASLVSGPSRSADIERQLTIGVHGPRALHLLLVT